MNNTPRTDELIDSCGDYEKPHKYIARLTEFARKLERENAELKARIAELEYRVEELEKSIGFIADDSRPMTWDEAETIAKEALAKKKETT